MTRLSAFLITRNEARDIEACLASLRGWVDEVVVVDDFSEDRTPALCAAAGARVWSRRLQGFADQKQFALDQTTGDWALSIDADERVPPALAREIQEAIARPGGPAGYRLRRQFYFLGRRIRFGGVGEDKVLRLFRRVRGRFQSVRVHERIVVDGPVGDLREALRHFSYDSLEEYFQKREHYTSLAAQDLYAQGRRFSWRDYLRPGWELVRRVGLMGAWLDGRLGLKYAALSAQSAWLRAAKLRALEREEATRL